MNYLRRMILFLLIGVFLSFNYPALAIPPDFNADRRVNVKCPSTIDDGFKHTIKRLYHELDKNLKSSYQKETNGKKSDIYIFSDDPNQGRFYICHAKAFFPHGNLGSLAPKSKINFQEVFYITKIDWNTQEIEIARQRDRKKFSIDVPDFEKAFLWYNALLDKNRAYIPVYGFLSLPGEASEFPTIWNSWESHQTDTATPPESLVDYDFYKILDYRNGYYLLGKDYNELDYRSNVEDFGIIGWVKRDYITLWRSRLYYHPMQPVQFFNTKNDRDIAVETGEINSFYVEHVYLKERLFNDIVEKLDQESLHEFYSHFGFPQLTHPESIGGHSYSKVFVPGAFTPRIMKLLSKSLKRNLNTFFLLDVSESMRPFADYVKSFNKSVSDMKNEGIGLRMNKIYAYWDSSKSDKDISIGPNFTQVKRAESLVFGHKSRDRNYSEPLMRAFVKALGEIESLQKQKLILPLHEKLLFIITDAGPNDLTKEAFSETVKK